MSANSQADADDDSVLLLRQMYLTYACSRSAVRRPALLPTARKWFGNSLAP